MQTECGYCRGIGQVNTIDGGSVVCRYCLGRGHVFAEADVKAFIYNMAQKPGASAVIVQAAHLINREGNTLCVLCELVEALDNQLFEMMQKHIELLKNSSPAAVIIKDSNDKV